MKKVKVTESTTKEKGIIEIMQEKLDELKSMSAKQLVEYAKKEFRAEFNIGNDRPWLYKKIAYLEQERLTGNKGNAAVRAANLDKPEKIEKAKGGYNMKCCLCNNKIEVKGTWTQGNNAQPLANGRCCDVCNDIRVIPARLAYHKK